MQHEQERVYILIDGQNFFYKLRDLQLHWYDNKDTCALRRTLDFSRFARFLIGNATLVKATYYVGKIKTDGTEKSKDLLASQQRLLDHLKKHGFRYELGRRNKDFEEKGVDVHIAVDMLIGAYEDLYDTIYLVCSDSDFEQAVKKVQEKGKNVVYVGSSHNSCDVLNRVCPQKRMLDKADLRTFVQY